MQGRAYRIRCQFNAMHNLDLEHPEKMPIPSVSWHTWRMWERNWKELMPAKGG